MPGKSHGRRSLAGCSPWGHEESDTTERHLLFTTIIIYKQLLYSIASMEGCEAGEIDRGHVEENLDAMLKGLNLGESESEVAQLCPSVCDPMD